ncbi:MAG: MerR family transcriptional regulator [Hydrogenophilales bacterium]|nr:MerR family transcriptional regulator [Hydrogenophilales bacterium]
MKRLNTAELPLKIGDVAEMLDTSIRAIRYYEEEGLLSPLRSDGGTRLYSSRHIDRLRAILRLSKAGYSIDIIKTLAKTREQSRTGDESQRAVSQQMNALLTDISAQIERLDSLHKQIAAAKRTVMKCSGCGNSPTTKGCPKCPVQQRLSDIELLNLVWDEGE